MYKELCSLLAAGYEVTLRPVKKGNVKLTVQEARNGTVKGVEVELIPFEWDLVEDGITQRLREAMESLGVP